jgi:CheY-like chemotaxis protein
MQNTPHLILLLEDNPDDVFLMDRAFKKNGINDRLVVLGDGQEGIDYLSGAGRFQDRKAYPLPDVVIADLKMPRKTGLEFLAWVKAHPEAQTIPTILLSTSNQEVDVKSAYELGANTYFIKPGGFQELVELVKTLHRYWTSAMKPIRHP